MPFAVAVVLCLCAQAKFLFRCFVFVMGRNFNALFQASEDQTTGSGEYVPVTNIGSPMSWNYDAAAEKAKGAQFVCGGEHSVDVVEINGLIQFRSGSQIVQL